MFRGPAETGAKNSSHSISWNNSKCGVPTRANNSQPSPPTPWLGQVTDTLNDPYTEVISGSRTLFWTINANGEPVASRANNSGGVSRIPAIPGAPALPQGGEVAFILPWLGALDTLSGLDGEPTIKMDITWNFSFGG